MEKERLPKDLTTEEFYKNYLGAAGDGAKADNPDPADSIDVQKDSRDDSELEARNALEEAQAIEYDKE